MTILRQRRRRFAQGKNAIAECQRSGQKMRYQDLVEDGHIPRLLVHPDWYEPRHPQELPVDTSDAVALWWPAPELSVNEGEFDTLPAWIAWVPSDCPPTPEDQRFFENTTLATAANLGNPSITVDDAVIYEGEICLYVELDAGGWSVLKTAIRTESPTFTVPLLAPFYPSLASPGNDVFISPLGSRDPRLDGSWAVT